MLVLSIFAALGLTLAAVGIYGVLSYLVTQRSHEVGIRMALGAQRRDLYKLVVGHGALLVLTGVALGIPAAIAASRLISNELFGLNPGDPLTVAMATMLLISVAALSGYLPARRASRVDPMVALRYE
jgi:putative ABC transport system permease protein